MPGAPRGAQGKLNDEALVRKALPAAAAAGGLEVISEAYHRFEPQGVRHPELHTNEPAWVLCMSWHV